jgi:hypothetical protein
MQGINASSVCDLMVEAKFEPGDHITQAFKNQLKIPVNFGINLKFHMQRGVEIYRCYKRELPEDMRQVLKTEDFCLADPQQAEEGCDTMFIHGIIGEDMINEMEESIITKVGSVGLKTTRSFFGDILHGKSHFIKFPYKSGKLELKEEQEFATDGICQCGVVPIYISDSSGSGKEFRYQGEEHK